MKIAFKKIAEEGVDLDKDRIAEIKHWETKLVKTNTLIRRLERLDPMKLRDATTVMLNSCDVICTTLGSISKLRT